MEKLVQSVKAVIKEEYDRAAEKYGCVHSSDHEGFAVLLEEFEETTDEIAVLNDRIPKLWKLVKGDGSDSYKTEILKEIQDSAMLAACEAIQVAAMAYKARLTIFNRGEAE